MKDERKTKKQLINELVELRQRITELEKIETERKRAEEEVQRHLERLSGLREIDRVISSTLDLPEVLVTILEQLERVIPYHSAALYLLTDDTAKVIAASGVPDLERAMQVSFSVKDDALAQQLLEEKRPLVLADAQADKRFQARGGAEYVRSWMGVPLIVREEVIGFLTIDHREPGVYDEESTETALSFANQVAITIENARLYEETQARSAYLETLLRINATLRSTLPLREVLDTIVRATTEALGYVGSFIAMPDATGECLTLGAAWGGRVVDAALRVTRFKLESFSVPVKVQENLIARAFVRGELQAATGNPEAMAVGTEPSISGKMASAIERISGAKGTACVPLRVGEKSVGVLIIVSPREQLADEERAMLLGLADQAGLAIENARLYEETQRHLEQVTALREIDRAISSTLDLPEVLVIILEQLERLVPYHSAALFLLTDDSAKVTAARGFPDLEQAMQVSFPVKDDALFQQLLEEKRPLVLTDAQTDERFQARGETEYVRSWIGVPLIVREEVIGFLTIDHREPSVYDEENAEMAQAFASQVAIAIENARAHERLKTQNLETISALATAVEAKDPYTSGHSEKVTQFAVAIAEKMRLSNDEIEDLQVAALLHDIGKIGIPDSVLNKPARLTSAEFLMVKAHPVISAEIVGNIEALAHLVPIIRHHHERWDGAGYPDGLKGEDIPLLARILAVADGFDAMTSERPYRFAKSQEEAIQELKAGAGSQWDPQVVEALVKMQEEGALKHQAGGQ